MDIHGQNDKLNTEKALSVEFGYKKQSEINKLAYNAKFNDKTNKRIAQMNLKAALTKAMKKFHTELLELLPTIFKKSYERYGEVSKGKRLPFYMIFENERIEAIADKLKFGKVSDLQEKSFLETSLISFIVDFKKIGTFDEEKSGTAVIRDNINYSGDIFCDLIRDAFKDYGKIDERTNQRKPYLKIINEYYPKYQKKMYYQNRECDTDKNLEVRFYKINIEPFMKDICKLYGLPAYQRREVGHTLSSCIKYLQEHNVPRSEIEKLEKLGSSTGVYSLEAEQEKQLEGDSQSSYSKDSKQSKDEYDRRNNDDAKIIDLMVYVKNKLKLEDTSRNHIMLDYVDTYFSLQILKTFYDEGKDYYDDFIDSGFKIFYQKEIKNYINDKNKLTDEKSDELVSAYYKDVKNQKISPRTIRSYRSKIINLLLKEV